MKRVMCVLADKKSYKITVDANATYREYWCAEKHDDPNAVVLSSDDCQEYMEVTIQLKVDASSNSEIYTWEGVRRDDKKKVLVDDGVKVPISHSPGGTPKGIWKRITGFFSQG